MADDGRFFGQRQYRVLLGFLKRDSEQEEAISRPFMDLTDLFYLVFF